MLIKVQEASRIFGEKPAATYEKIRKGGFPAGVVGYLAVCETKAGMKISLSVNGPEIRLVENWEQVVDEVAKGYQLDLDSYLNDMDVRQLIEEVLSIAEASDSATLKGCIAAADRQMKSVVKRARECLLGLSGCLGPGMDPGAKLVVLQPANICGSGTA